MTTEDERTIAEHAARMAALNPRRTKPPFYKGWWYSLQMVLMTGVALMLVWDVVAWVFHR